MINKMPLNRVKNSKINFFDSGFKVNENLRYEHIEKIKYFCE